MSRPIVPLDAWKAPRPHLSRAAWEAAFANAVEQLKADPPEKYVAARRALLAVPPSDEVHPIEHDCRMHLELFEIYPDYYAADTPERMEHALAAVRDW